MSAWIGLAWAALVVSWSFRRRPAPVHPSLRRRSTPRSARRRFGAGPRSSGPLVLVGRAVRERVPLLRSMSPALVGAVTVLAGPAVLVSPGLAGLSLLVAAGWSVARGRSRRRAEHELLVRQLPAAIDLFRMCLASGLTPRLALSRVAATVPAPLVDHLGPVAAQADRGRTLADAISPLAGQGPPIGPFASAVLHSESTGLPLDGMLERQAVRARSQARRLAQERARRLPVLMLLPMVCCALPALLLVVVVPVIVHGLAAVGGR